MTRQANKAEAFRALHAGEPFVIPNPWDAGSARMFEALGFQALATTSSGFAFTLGRLDSSVTLDEIVAHTAALDAATGLPVSVDLENGYGAAPEDAALAITRRRGGRGGRRLDRGLGPRRATLRACHAVERVAAAVEAARSLDFPFTLTARAENHIRDNPDLDDTIARLQGVRGGGGRRALRAGASHRRRTSAPSARRSRSRSTCWRCRRCRRPRSSSRRAADQRRRRAHLGRDRRAGRGGDGDPRRRRPLVLGARVPLGEWFGG